MIFVGTILADRLAGYGLILIGILYLILLCWLLFSKTTKPLEELINEKYNSDN
jgi:hypothetical protein